MICPSCGTPAPEGARFCEVDGTQLTPANAPGAVIGNCRCGAGPDAIDEQGFCTECGRKRLKQTRDHSEVSLAPNFGGVTDRGRRHRQNEDDFALVLERRDDRPVCILVVCDGVSSSQHAEMASAAACGAVREVLSRAVREGLQNPKEAMAEAIRAANKAVCLLPHVEDDPKDPPETTLVAALVQDGVATIGWVGDSRAYWIGAGGSGLLTHDHSWVNDRVDSGQMSEEEAMHAPEAHAITRSLGLWEGVVSEEASEPSFVTFPFPSHGSLLLCSDGLWNYVSEPEKIAALIRQMPEGADAQVAARMLVEYANAQGGRDNITVAIAAFSAA